MSLDEKLELLTDIATDARRCKKHLLKATLHEYHLVQNLTRFYDIAREHESELDRIGAADNEKKVRMEENNGGSNHLRLTPSLQMPVPRAPTTAAAPLHRHRHRWQQPRRKSTRPYLQLSERYDGTTAVIGI